MTMRIFVALPVPDPVYRRIAPLMTGMAGARWQDAEQLHLTLRFAGDVDGRVAADLADALARIDQSCFSVRLRDVGTFGEGGRPNSLWIGVEPSEPLVRLHRKVERACVAAGLGDETRVFRPHVTIARFARSTPPPPAAIAGLAGRDWGEMRVDRIILYESVLGHGGSRYTPLFLHRLRPD